MAEPVRETIPTYKEVLKKSILFGLLGIDRFYIGDTGLGLTKLLLSIFTFGLYCVPWWITDILIIKSHEADWEVWLARKAEKRKHKEVMRRIKVKAQTEGQELMAERKRKGLCTACGSDKVQAMADTNSQAQLTDAFANILPHGRTHLEQKIRTKMVVVCLSCGFKRPL